MQAVNPCTAGLLSSCESQYQTVCDGHKVQIMQAFGKFVSEKQPVAINDAEQGAAVVTIDISQTTPLARLQKPSATFIKRCAATQTKVTKVSSQHQTEGAGTEAEAATEVGGCDDDANHSGQQMLGLNMLAEEAEANVSTTEEPEDHQGLDEVS